MKTDGQSPAGTQPAQQSSNSAALPTPVAASTPGATPGQAPSQSAGQVPPTQSGFRQKYGDDWQKAEAAYNASVAEMNRIRNAHDQLLKQTTVMQDMVGKLTQQQDQGQSVGINTEAVRSAAEEFVSGGNVTPLLDLLGPQLSERVLLDIKRRQDMDSAKDHLQSTISQSNGLFTNPEEQILGPINSIIGGLRSGNVSGPMRAVTDIIVANARLAQEVETLKKAYADRSAGDALDRLPDSNPNGQGSRTSPANQPRSRSREFEQFFVEEAARTLPPQR